MSDRSLTGYDNVDANSGARDEQVYLYEAPSHQLACASCNPSLGRPAGPSSIPRGTIFSNEGRGGEALHQSRVLSSDGKRLFFDSGDALLPQDSNGKQDVYEYENGGVHLLSGGTSGEDTSFVDASLNGDDVFFITKQQLVGQDNDELSDLYDARANGGFAQVAGSGGPCQGEGCRLPAAPVPGFAFPTTTALGGAGNLNPVVRPVTKHRTKSRVKHKRHKQHKRKAKHQKGHRSRAKADTKRAKAGSPAPRGATHRTGRR
jgi:hypothetical protein